VEVNRADINSAGEVIAVAGGNGHFTLNGINFPVAA